MVRRITLQHPLGIAFRLFAFSTLLCVFTCHHAICVSWTRDVSWQPRGILTRELSIESGQLFASQRFNEAVSSAERTGYYISTRMPEPLGYHDSAFRAMTRLRRRDSRGYSRVTIPLWPLTLLTLIPALRFAGRKYDERVARRRLRRGCCVDCGYDLRASGDRCPECGLATTLHDPPERISLAI